MTKLELQLVKHILSLSGLRILQTKVSLTQLSERE